MIKEFFSDLVKYIPSIVGPAAFGLITVFIVTKLFTPEEYGNYALVLVTVSVFGIIAFSWLTSSIIRFLPVHIKTEGLKRFYTTISILTISSVGLITIVFWVTLLKIRFSISTNLYSLMKIGFLVFIILSLYDVLLTVLRAKRKVITYSAFYVWRYCAPLLIGLILIFLLNFGIEGLLWGSFLGLVAAFPLLYKYVFKASFPNVNLVSTSMSKEIIKFGLPLVPTYLFTWALSLSDRYILEFFRGSQEVGLYSVGYDISDKSIQLITSLFMIASGPIIVYIWEDKGKEATQDFIKNLTRYYMIISLPLVLCLSMLSRPILKIFTAPDYLEGSKIVPLVAFGSFFVGLQWIAQRGLILGKKTNIIMFIFMGCSLFNISLNVLLVPKYGFIATGITTLVSYLLLFLLIAIASNKYLHFNIPYRSVKNIIFASLIMGVVIYFLNNSIRTSNFLKLFLTVSISIFVYFLSLFLLKEFQKTEIEKISTLINKFFKTSSKET